MTFRTLAIAVGLLFAATACADFERGPRPVEEEADTTTTDDDSSGGNDCIDHAPLFDDDIYNILDNDCGLCHASGGSAGSTGLALTGNAADDYSMVEDLLDMNDPPSSILITKGLGASHGGGALWDADDCAVDIITLWIENGAPE